MRISTPSVGHVEKGTMPYSKKSSAPYVLVNKMKFQNERSLKIPFSPPISLTLLILQKLPAASADGAVFGFFLIYPPYAQYLFVLMPFSAI